MKDQKSIREDSLKNEKKKVKSDSIEIRSRLASRLGTIQNELKSLQSSLTKNQIIKEGITQLKEDYENGKQKMTNILSEIKFENKNVLNDFLGKNINYETILNRSDAVAKLIEKDLAGLKSLQVEIENIVASNLVNSDIADVVSGIEKSLSNLHFSAMHNISDLKPDMVMGLIR
jgi:hypothetical protein